MLRGSASFTIYILILGKHYFFYCCSVYPSVIIIYLFVNALVKCSKALLFVNSCKEFGLSYLSSLTRAHKWAYTFPSLVVVVL